MSILVESYSISIFAEFTEFLRASRFFQNYLGECLDNMIEKNALRINLAFSLVFNHPHYFPSLFHYVLGVRN